MLLTQHGDIGGEFLLCPSNRAFRDGLTAELPTARTGQLIGWLLLFMAPFILAGSLLAVRALSEAWQGHAGLLGILVAAGWNLIVVVAILLLVAKFRRQRALLRPQRLVGEVVKAHLSSRRKGNRYLTVEYLFRDPAGHPCRGRAATLREDLAEADVPAPGTAVGIAYASAAHHTVI